MRVRLVPILGSAFLLLAAAAAAQNRPAAVTTALVEEREVAETVSVFGQVVAGRESNVAARIGGVVDEVPVDVGDVVTAGAVLARVDTELLNIELRQAEAALAEARAGVSVAEARLERTRKDFERIEGLRGSAAFSQGAFEDREGALAEARGQRAQAEARILNAEAAMARAQYDFDNAVIRAPFAGTVLEVVAETGQFIQTGATVARILDTEGVEVEANVPAEYVGGLSAGTAVTGRTDYGGTLEMTVRAVLPTEFAQTRTRPVRLTTSYDGAGRPIAVGQSILLDVPVSAPRLALTVPKDALVQGQGGWTVFLNADGKAEPRKVEVGKALGDAFEVLSGLVTGDEVVIRGNERLRPMQEIEATLQSGAKAEISN